MPAYPDVHPADVVLGVLGAAAVMVGTWGLFGAMAAALPTEVEIEETVPIQSVFAGELDAASEQPQREAGTAAVDSPADPVPRPQTPSETPAEAVSSVDAPADPPPAQDVSSSRSSAVPPRPQDAPRPRGTRPTRPRGGIRGLPRVSGPVIEGLPQPPAEEEGSAASTAESGFGRGGPEVSPGDAPRASSPKDPYAYVDPATESPDAPATGSTAAGVDPRVQQAINTYRGRIQRWFSIRFTVRGQDLPADVRREGSVRAVVTIGPERTVVSYELGTADHPALAAAAKRALDAAVGKQLPRPPSHYPGPLPQTIRVTFECTEDRCD